MKIINFINPIHPQDEYSFMIWFRLSITLLVLTTVFLAYIQYEQICLWRSYRNEYKHYNTLTKQHTQVIEEKKKLEKQEQELKNKTQHINDLHSKCVMYIEKLNSLQTLCTNNIQFISCSLLPKGMEITLNCDSVEQAQWCCSILNQHNKDMKMNIASIVPKKHMLNVTFKN